MTIRKRRKNYHQRLHALTFVLGLFLLAAGIFYGYKVFTDRQISADYSTRQNQTVSPKNLSIPTKSVSLSKIKNTHCLDLINSDYAIQEADEPTLWKLSAVNGKIATLEDQKIFLQKPAQTAVKQLVEATENAVGGNIALSSGFRSYDEQKQLYAEAEDKSFVQVPGHSEHESGFAADISIQDVEDVANSEQSVYLRENAWKYGLILRYPAGKQDITGIANEAWHFRYVGKIHAWYCTSQNMAYEEYIDFLKKSGGYTQELDGITYTVSYQTPKNHKLQLPKSGKYEVSSDNTGGYVVTSWK
ncbi:MAG: M15 family metallopeptidase [Streptococcaceae bacterium]|jgi:D-alanyl-D-alanine carboxypeptidase|nr:M15 family metallopeptidase [Streptococcaceae bacterium]